jgi:hypothetical protein
MDSLAPMGRVQDGKVYITLDADSFDEIGGEARWSGSLQFLDDSLIEEGPTFRDASDAVSWWRSRGANEIYIRLDDEYSWAGEGAPPDDWAARPIFDQEDPRGWPDGAKRTIEARRRAGSEQASAEQAAAASDEGRHLSVLRESAGLSIDELANRVGVPPQWLLDVESGTPNFDATMSQWIQVVWATRPGWPDAMSKFEPPSNGWVVRNGRFLSEAERIVNSAIALED